MISETIYDWGGIKNEEMSLVWEKRADRRSDLSFLWV